MKRILFVDDEAPILEGLQNLLRRQRHRWEMAFALGGEEALRRLDEQRYDVVVSDLRMPGMDGARLLQEVRDRHPDTARIVLSGHADREALVRAIPVAHQLLAKPCDPEVLRVVIERTCALQARLADDGIRRLLGRVDHLPSAPRTYWELTRRMADPEVTAAELAPIIEQDPAMVVRVLQLVNSVYFGLSQPVLSVRHAVTYLGLELLRGLALSAHVFALPRELGGEPVIAVEELQARALLTARVARRLLADDPLRAEEAFTAGMVHDIGRLVLALEVPAAWSAIVREAARTGRREIDVEAERLGVTHAEVGAYLLGVWGLPFSIVEAVADHHVPSRVTEGDRAVLAAVHVASALVNRDNDIDVHFLRSAGQLAELDGWTKLAADELRGHSL